MMKFLVKIFFLLIIFSCNKKQEKIPGCIESYEIARKDSENKKYIYYEYQYLTDDTTSNKSFKKLSRENNIQVIFKTKYPISDVYIEDPEMESEKCYETMMNNQMEAKFGNIFFDSLRLKSK